MIRTLLRLILLLIVIAAAAAFYLGYRINNTRPVPPDERPVGTSGPVDPGRARDVGASIGEKVAAGANEAERVISDSGLTAKIKSKMALDDTVKALAIDIDTTNGVVTLSGNVSSEAEHSKAVQLAKETQGVRSVVDHLAVRRP
jgi:hyperosmotically inducible protein